MQRYRRALILIALALVFIIPSLIAVITTRPAKAAAEATRTFTFVNNTSQTIWVASQGNTGLPAPGNGGWVMAPGSTTSLTVSDTWVGRFWGRTYCNFNSSGAGTCETGDCGGVLQCNGAGGIPPATWAEILLGGSTNKDFYDVSYVDGFNVPITITPVGGAQPTPGNPYWCGVAGCGVDLNANCPSALRQIDGSGRTVACKSACAAFNTDQYCCRGAYATAATCIPSQWPVNYAAYFKSNCPNSYSYAFDDPTSTFTDQGANYQITFGPAGGGGGGGGSGYNYIVNRNSGKVLDVTGWSTTDGTTIEQWTQGNGQANQEWSLNPTGDGYYYIVNRNSGKVLDVTGWSTTDGTSIEQWTQGSGQANQEWSLNPTGDGYDYIVNRNSGKVLDVTGWSTTDGTTIEQWTQGNGQANQEWSLVAA